MKSVDGKPQSCESVIQSFSTAAAKRTPTTPRPNAQGQSDNYVASLNKDRVHRLTWVRCIGCILPGTKSGAFGLKLKIFSVSRLHAASGTAVSGGGETIGSHCKSVDELSSSPMFSSAGGAGGGEKTAAVSPEQVCRTSFMKRSKCARCTVSCDGIRHLPRLRQDLLVFQRGPELLFSGPTSIRFSHGLL